MVGELVLSWESFAVTSAPGQLVAFYQAEPGSTSEQALKLLASAIAGAERPAAAQSAVPGAAPVVAG